MSNPNKDFGCWFDRLAPAAFVLAFLYLLLSSCSTSNVEPSQNDVMDSIPADVTIPPADGVQPISEETAKEYIEGTSETVEPATDAIPGDPQSYHRVGDNGCNGGQNPVDGSDGSGRCDHEIIE